MAGPGVIASHHTPLIEPWLELVVELLDGDGRIRSEDPDGVWATAEAMGGVERVAAKARWLVDNVTR